MFIDTHAHMYFENYQDDFSEVISRIHDQEIDTVINIGVDLATSKLAAELESGRADVNFYATVGIHPHEAKNYSTSSDVSIHTDIGKIVQLYQMYSKKIIGIGECGLDFFFPEGIPSPFSKLEIQDLQRKLFIAQIEIAQKFNLPLSVHCRDDRSSAPDNVECWEETLELTKKHFGVFHCYSGLESIFPSVLASNFLVSFAANITYPKNDYLRQCAQNLPLDRIVLETDSPFLAPQSIRGKRNDPTSVREVASLIAEIKGFSIEEVATITSQNARKMFKLI